MDALRTNADLSAVRRALFGSSRFLIDNWSFNHARLSITGWCISEYEGALGFTIGGSRPHIERLGLPSPSLVKVFPFFPSAAASAFTLEAEVSDGHIARGWVDVSLCDLIMGEALNPWHVTWIPTRNDRLALPDEDQLWRTQGNGSIARYLAYGLTTAMRLELILDRYFRRDLGEFELIVDWGVGCGRVARHIAHRAKGFAGFDIDYQNVQWCKNSLNGVFDVNGLLPPLSIEDNSVDFLYGISVFTHLSADAAALWRDEIHRILRPDGICIVTVHGTTGIAGILDDRRLMEIARSGFDASALDDRLDGFISDRQYYRASYQTPQDVHRFFGEKFRVVDQIRGANALNQDFVVMQKRF